MRRRAFDVAWLLALPTVALVAVLAVAPGVRTTTVHAYLLAVAAVLLRGLVAAIGERIPGGPSAFDRALAPAASSEPGLPELERVERAVTLATASAYDLHLRLLPDLREIAEARLERTGRRPGPDTLGRWWELLRPDRPLPDDRTAPGLPVRELRALTDDLARM